MRILFNSQQGHELSRGGEAVEGSGCAELPANCIKYSFCKRACAPSVIGIDADGSNQKTRKKLGLDRWHGVCYNNLAGIPRWYSLSEYGTPYAKLLLVNRASVVGSLGYRFKRLSEREAFLL